LAAPRVVQVAMCSADLPHTLRLYTEVFGFADAGGRAFWGPWLGVQALGPDAAALVWWLVGRQDFVQLEVFHHTSPAQRPLPEDWRPSDHGWVRWGLAVPDFDAALERLRAMGIEPLGEPAERDGLQRVCFRDPDVGVIVEMMEDGEALPGGIRPRHYDLVPAIVYAAISVADLGRARAFFVDTLGLAEEYPDLLHDDELQSLWGLGGASCERFVVRGGDIYIEVVRYDDPAGRPRPAGSRLSDQGLMNVAAGSRDRADLERLYERIVAGGYRPNAELMPGSAGGTYLEDADGNSFEVLAVPREFDPLFGFTPGAIFDPHPFWPQPGAPPAATSGS
jgi:catechol 2,3-dioxygenase-like lactoylglutathione lyase family enzyme